MTQEEIIAELTAQNNKLKAETEELHDLIESFRQIYQQICAQSDTYRNQRHLLIQQFT